MKKEIITNKDYEDFVNSIILKPREIEVLKLYIKDYSIVKIASEVYLSTSSVSRIIKELKYKYQIYKLLKKE